MHFKLERIDWNCWKWPERMIRRLRRRTREREEPGIENGKVRGSPAKRSMVPNVEAGSSHLQTIQEGLEETRNEGKEVKWEAENRGRNLGSKTRKWARVEIGRHRILAEFGKRHGATAGGVEGRDGGGDSGERHQGKDAQAWRERTSRMGFEG